MRLIVILLLSIFLQSEAHAFGKKPIRVPQTPPDPAESEVIRARWEFSQRDGAQWSKHAFNSLDSLGGNLLSRSPADISEFCPNYQNLSKADKKNFWVYLLSSMTEFESGHRPETSYKEAFFDAQGNNVISRGLLQLSIESANAYGCGFQSAQEIHDPMKNLSCGIRILNRWVGNDQRLAGKINSKWLGGARYWSVLRFSNAPLAKIQSQTRAISICR